MKIFEAMLTEDKVRACCDSAGLPDKADVRVALV